MTSNQREFDPGSEAFTRAVALMHSHYQDDLLLKHVAEAVGYSVQHLNRLFHQRQGVTGHQYMQRLRLQKASEWLDKNPRASVREQQRWLAWRLTILSACSNANSVKRLARDQTAEPV